ncbi:MAG: YbaK/EbsC family protein [Candidatus Aenigmatarchaeota archaeon]
MLSEYLKSKGIWHRFIEKPIETSHTLESALSVNLDPQKVSKSLVVLDSKNNAYVVIIPGNKKLNFNKVKAAFNLKKVHLALPEKAKNYSGYDPGETPPLAYLNIKAVGLDKSFLKYETMFGGGGSKKLIVELKVDDVIKLNNAILDDFCD